MYGWKLPTIWATASVVGGVFFTSLSGLYIVRPFIMDAEIICFGFPLTWLRAERSLWMPNLPWHYSFLWQNFIVNFIIYGLLTASVVYLYLITITAGRK